MKQRLDKILPHAGTVGLALIVAGGAFICWSQRLHLDRFTYLGEVACIVGLVVFFGKYFGVFTQRSKSWQAYRQRQATFLKGTEKHPEIESGESANAIVSLNWTYTMREYQRQYARCMVYDPHSWYWMLACGGFTSICAAIAFGPDAMGAIILCFLAGACLGAYSLSRSLFSAVESYGKRPGLWWSSILMIKENGIFGAMGDLKGIVSWSNIRSASYRGGAVVLIHSGRINVIPSFAFKSPGDARAFVDTITAMKDGKPPPAYDWSSYKAHVGHGVWPPPIHQ